jgi:hypothetical protein
VLFQVRRYPKTVPQLFFHKITNQKVDAMPRKAISPEINITVKAKQRRDGLWVAVVRIDPDPSPEIIRALNSGVAFPSRVQAEAHVMKVADELIHKAKAKTNKTETSAR